METQMQQIAAKLTEAGYDAWVWEDHLHGQRVTARIRSLVASAYHENDGRIRVSTFIDYGDDGTSWCGSKSLKSTAGIVRNMSQFLGEVA